MKRHGISDYKKLLLRSANDISWYWDSVNEDLDIKWIKKYDKVFDTSRGLPYTKWFVNGRCNIVDNAITRHLKTQPDKVAYIFENSQGKCSKITYRQLGEQVDALALSLKRQGIRKGDVVAVYLPMIAEAFITFFACSKIGAVHAPIFSGYGSQALKSRLADSGARILITADDMNRRSNKINLKSHWSRAVKDTDVSRVVSVNGECESENNVISFEGFLKGEGQGQGQWEELQTEVMDSEDPLFILYTSGTTGRPKGTIQVHGGFTLTSAQQTAYLIDMKNSDTLFWYADPGWITGQTWVVYGSALVGGTSLVYEDAIDYPSSDTWCNLIERHRVSIFGSAPTAIRLFIKNNVRTDEFSFSTLRMLATTGEPINREAWMWFFENVGKRCCPVINLAGGTEIGGAIVSAVPVIDLKPTSVGMAVPGFDIDIVDDQGRQKDTGYLVIKKPWPSMTRGILNDNKRYLQIYWSRFEGMWYHGDIILRDIDGFLYMRGRADDVIKVSGHRIGAAEIESAVSSHHNVAEAAAVGIADSIKGESIVVCVVLKNTESLALGGAGLREELIKNVEDKIGKFARPDNIKFVQDLPRTRTGKIVRRLIRAKLMDAVISDQDLLTVENPMSLEGL